MSKPTKNTLIENAKLFISIRLNNLEDVKCCFKNGANVNARDANDLNNSPLHIATEEQDIKLINEIISMKPKILKNDYNRTALDIAKEINSSSQEEIILALETYVKEKCPKIQGPTGSRIEITSSSNEKGKTHVVLTCNQREGTAGAAGQLYETKLLSLLFLNALQSYPSILGTFYLGTNIQGPGDFDDICFKYYLKDDNTPKTVFMQLKHRSVPSKGKLTVDKLFGSNKDFNLRKYFKSFLSIKAKFNAKVADLMFDGQFDDLLLKNSIKFIIFTSAEEAFVKKKITDQCDDTLNIVNNLICTSPKGKAFRFDYDSKDISKLVDILMENCINKLGKTIGKFIFTENDKSYKNMMRNQDIQKYHVILAKYVFDIFFNNLEPDHFKGIFKDSFLRQNNYNSEFINENQNILNILKMSLCKEIVNYQKNIKCLTFKEINKRVHEIIESPTPETISLLIGHTLIYRRESGVLELIDTNMSQNLLTCGTSDQRDVINKMLKNLLIDPSIIDAAIEARGIALLQKLGQFKLPHTFGNIDVKVNKGNRLNQLIKIINLMINNSNSDYVFKLDEEFITKNKNVVTKNDLKTNNGIGGLVGNLLVQDNELMMLKFSDYGLINNAKYILTELKKEHRDLSRYRFNIQFDDFPQLTWHSKNDLKTVFDFLDNLWFYTNQHKEDEVGIILESKVHELCNIHETNKNDYTFFRFHHKCVYLKYHESIQNWWLQPKEYLTTTCEYFAKAKEDVVIEPVLTFLNLGYLNFLRGRNIVFKKDLIRSIRLCQYKVISKCNKFIEINNSSYLCINSIEPTVTCLKIVKYLDFYNSSYICIDLTYVMNEVGALVDLMLSEITKTNIKIVLLIVETYNNSYESLIKQIFDSINAGNKTVKTFIISGVLQSKEIKKHLGDINFEEVNDDDLSSVILPSSFNAKEEKVTLRQLITKDNMREIINKDVMRKIELETVRSPVVRECSEKVVEVAKTVAKEVTKAHTKTKNELRRFKRRF